MGVQVDYYLMDAFWFDVNEGYRKWRSDCWPEGPKRWLDACKREGIKPGLWFSTNLLRIGGEANTMKVIPEWESSVAEDGVTLCLFRRIFTSSYADSANVRRYGYQDVQI